MIPARPDERPLRRDAERNRQRIVAAAAEVFGERGLDATLDDVARRAGVGVGTVYRRFPDKESLVGELFEDRINALAAAAESACEAEDPWLGLQWYLEFLATTMAGDLGLRQMLLFATYGTDRVAYLRERIRPVAARLVERAQAAGQLRDDVCATDIPMLAIMLATAAEYAAPVQPALWRRYLALIAEGLRPSREGAAPLPVAALDPAQMEQLMRTHSNRARSRRPGPS
ncbi:MAG TPA: helix-turn-helix domain-containing protein [Trebonia sp.]|jgi:AcrR family transcriptional regulator|nr:helix-turn-helix domain-containing protein [Trebonia sp.]